MIRVIQSPGVQIAERDLSFNTTIQAGTNVLIHGFAPQGPTYELIYVSGREDFEQTFFGSTGPTNAAERYFYQDCVEVLNSPANLLVTRFPYGSGDGVGYDGEYSALIYPVSGFFYVSAAAGVPLTGAGSTFGSGSLDSTFNFYTLSASGNITISTTLTSYDKATYYKIGTPVLSTLNETQYQGLLNDNVAWNSGTGVGGLLNAGFVVINTAKTTIDEAFEGFYLALADNSTVSLTGYDAVQRIYSVNTSNSEVTVPTSLLAFSLTGDANSTGNMSEQIENSPNFDFSNRYYEDGLIFYMYKLRLDTFGNDPTKIQKIPMESFVGSFNPVEVQTNPQNGQNESFYLQNKINNSSNYVKLVVNKNFVNNTKWNYNNVKQVIVENTYEAAKNIGLFNSSNSDPTNKLIGNVPAKLNRALLLADNKESIDLDLIPETGLGTIWSYVQGTENVTGYDDTKDVQTQLDALYDSSTGDSSTMANNYKRQSL